MKRISIILVLMIFLTLPIVGIVSLNISIEKNKTILENKIDIRLKKAGFWNLIGTPIEIDDSDPTKNWSYTAATYDWCSGLGTIDDPYTLENITIELQGVSGHNIIIQNSHRIFIIRNCTVFRSGWSGWGAGIYLENVSNGQILECNISYNDPNGGPEGGILIVQNCSNIQIVGNYIAKNSIGIQFAGTPPSTGLADHIIIHENTIIDNTDLGIIGFDGDYCEISNNIMTNNSDSGITWSRINNSKIVSNIIEDHIGNGIFLSFCNSNVIADNYISRIGLPLIRPGIYLSDCDDNIVRGNTIIDCPSRGIWLSGGGAAGPSEYNVITENTIINCSRGIDMWTANWNTIYKNYISNISIEYAYDDGSNNKWDNGSIGNYWDDYDGIDANFDGIGDTPYNISGSAGNQDNFPIYWNPFLQLEVKLIDTIFMPNAFIIKFFIGHSFGVGIGHASIQMWWSGIEVSDDIIHLEGGYYSINLTPIFVASGEDPVLLNMTVSAIGYYGTYFETYFAIEPFELYVEITQQSFSQKEFNITFSVYNETNHGIDFASIQLWWNETDVSGDVQNLGNGQYFISLESITVAPGEDPILLKMTITASGYEDKNFETYIAVDPDTLQKVEEGPSEELPIALIMTISVISVGAVIGVAGIFWYRRRKREL